MASQSSQKSSQLSKKRFSGLFSGLLEGFLKPSCSLCQRPAARSAFCVDCDQQIQSCRWAHHDYRVPTPLPVIAWGTYSGPLKRALHQLKYQNCPEIAAPLGTDLGRLWQQAWSQKTALQRQVQGRQIVVVPIPLHPERLSQRGYNQAELIAQGFCRLTGLPCLGRGLLRVRATEAQHQFGLTTRQSNLRSAFRLGPDWTLDRMSSAVLLIDDIYTTGATAQAAATELQQSGLKVLGMATVARAILRHPGATAAESAPAEQRPRLSLTR
ncbi:MAG: ComF family protein [Cyanobacteria bacterium J06635_1]